MNTRKVLNRTLGVVLQTALAALLITTTVHAADKPAANPLVLAARNGIIGTPAPAVKLATIDGKTIDLAELYGKKAVYLKFWATWCIPCRQQMPHFENVYQHAGDDLAVIALNAGFNDKLQDILDYREDMGIHMPIVIDDGTLAGMFNLRITPQHVVIGKDGLIKHIGNLADAELDAAIEKERHAPTVSIAAIKTTLAKVPHLGAGDNLPTETLRIGAGTVALNDKTGKGTVLMFMIPWCESYLGLSRPTQAETCRAVREQVETLKQKYPALRWLGVSSGLWTAEADLPDYAAKNKVTVPLSLDGDGHLFRRFNVMVVPTMIVADANGKIISRIEGYDATLERIISAQLHQ